MDQRVLKAFRRESVCQILRLVRQNPDLFRGRTPQGNTTLHLAARLKDKRVADKILKLEASFLYAKNQNDETPMHIAAKAGNASVIEVMLEHDNNINVSGQERILCVRDNQGSTYIAWFIMKENPSSLDYRGPNDLTILHYAVINQNYVSVVEIVHRKEELIKEVDKDKRNPLHYAAVLGDAAIARMLLEADASSSVAYARDCNGQTPPHLAAKYGRRDMLRSILIDYSDSIEVVDEMKRNILHLAALNGKDETVRFILRLPEMEDLINSPDVHGNSPMHLAALNSHNHVVDILSKNYKVNKRATNLDQQTALAITRSSKDAKLDIKKEEKREMAQVVLLMATIIVTFTFIAALTLPGGYKDKDPHEGTARLVRKPGFETFVIGISIAMTSAMTAAVLALGQIRYKNHERLRDVDLMSLATFLVYFGLLSMSLAFMTGLYVVLDSHRALAIAAISVGCVFPYIVIFLATALEVGTYRVKDLLETYHFKKLLLIFLIIFFPPEIVIGLIVLSAAGQIVFLPLANKLLYLFLPKKANYLLVSRYIRWYDRQIESRLNSSRRIVHVYLVLALLEKLRDSLKSKPGQHTTALELTSTI